jgi:hypothetical protein
MVRRLKLRHWLWGISLCAGTGLSAVWLFNLGPRGAEISAVLSLYPGIAGMVLAFLSHIKPDGQPPAKKEDTDGTREAPDGPRRREKLRTLLIGGVAAVMGLAAASCYSFLIHTPDIDIIDKLAAREWSNIKTNSTISIELPEDPIGHRYLTLRFALTNHSPVGDCVVPAHFIVDPALDRKDNALIDDSRIVRATEGFFLDIGGALGRVEVRATLVEPDLECAVDIKLTEAILHN